MATKLLSNSSFGLLRTNPLLSSNVKLTVLEDNSFELNSFDTGKTLNQIKFKKFKTNQNSKWSEDLYKFWKDVSPELIFEPYLPINDEIISDNFANQFNMFYSYGTERVNSTLWDEEFKILAPLWIKETLPTKFIIFRIPNPINQKLGLVEPSSVVLKDSRWFLNEEQLQIVKVVDLSENSGIGKYLINHKNSFIDEPRPLYASFDQNRFSEYRGISLNSGSVGTSPENNYNILATNDSSQIEYDKFLTEGFKRNKIINSNLINLEFMFNDNEVEDFSINRYLGLYVQEKLDYEVTVKNFNGTSFETVEEISENFDSESSINYLKLNDSSFKIVDNIENYKLNLATELPPDTKLYEEFKSFDAFRENNGRDYLLLTIEGQPLHGDEYTFEGVGKIIGDFTLSPGTNINNRFSTRGNYNNVANAISKAINFKAANFFSSISKNNQVIIFSRSRFSYIGGKFKISKSLLNDGKIKIDGIEDGDGYRWVNFNTGFNKIITTSEINSIISEEGLDNLYVEATDGTFHNLDSIFKFLDKPIIKDDVIVSFEDFDNLISLQLNYRLPIKLVNGKLILFKRAKYDKGRFSIFPVKDFDFEFDDTEKDLIDEYNYENYNVVDNAGNNVLHPNFVDFLGERRKWKILDKNLDHIEFIDSSYDRLDENNNPRLSTLSKYTPHILKWVAGQNILKQDYRLNNSESFGILNGSPSFLIKNQNHYYFTHEWYDLGSPPEWFNLNNKLNLNQYYNSFFNTSEAISNLDEDLFTNYFTLEKIVDSGNEYPIPTRINYSTFDKFNRTFYKGVSVKMLERVENSKKIDGNLNSIEVFNNDKYKDYKFASILVPETDEIKPKTSLEVIVNEKWKWVLFVTKVNLNQNLQVLNSSGEVRVDYPMLYLLKDRIRRLNENFFGTYSNSGKNYDIIYSDIFLSGFLDLNLNPGSRSEKITAGSVWDIIAYERDSQGSIPNLLTELNVDPIGLFKEIRVYSKLLLNSYETTSDYIGVEVLDKISENSLKASRVYINTLTGEIDVFNELGDVAFWESRKSVYINGGYNYFTGLIEDVSFSNIKELINNGSPEVKYRTILENGEEVNNRFIIKFEEPNEVPKIVSLETENATIPSNLSGEVKVGTKFKEKLKPFIITLQRYSNNYEPKFNDVFKFVDNLNINEEDKNLNLFINYRDFVSGELSELRTKTEPIIKVNALKVSNLVNKDSLITSGRYPLIDETALYTENIPIFENNWNLNFYSNFTSKVNFEKLSMATTKEIKNYFGSKVCKLKSIITLESLNDSSFTINNSNSQISLNFDLIEEFVNKIYISLEPQVKDYILSTIDKETFLREYIKDNILNAYKLDEFKLWGTKSLIFDAFENSFDENKLRDSNYKIIKNFVLNKQNDFQINIIKDLLEETSFGVSINYKLK